MIFRKKNYSPTQIKKYDYLSDLEFYFKVALACVAFQWLFHNLFSGIENSIVMNIFLYWSLGLTSYYVAGFLIEIIINSKNECILKRNIRITKVKSKPYISSTFFQFIKSSLILLVIYAVIIIFLKNVDRELNFGWNFGWFLMQIIVADFLFFFIHYFLHHKKFIKYHKKHHEYRESSPFVAGYKGTVDLIVSLFADLSVIILFGYDIHQLLAWTVVVNIFNIEGHSGRSLFFVFSDFHDRHHTNFEGNYGIIGFWDKIFGTFISTNRATGIFWPVNTFFKNKSFIKDVEK